MRFPRSNQRAAQSSRWRTAALLAITAAALRAESTIPPPGSPPLATPLPSVVAFAKNHQIPLAGIEREGDGATARVGDEVFTLITLFKAHAVDQWLGHFRLVEPAAQEPGARDSEIVLYSSTGAKHVFTSTVSAIEMQLFGPFRGDATTKGAVGEKRNRMHVRADYLALGLESWYNDVLLRNEVPQPRFLPNSYSTTPFQPEQINKTSAIAREVGFTPAADRGAAGGELALGEFFSIAQRTPGLREIAQEGVEAPSLWSFFNVARIGVGFHWSDKVKVVTRFSPEAWGWPAVPAYRGTHVLILNGKIAANVALFVTAPVPPLSTCAGIVGFTVEPPNRPDRRVEMRVLAARRGNR